MISKTCWDKTILGKSSLFCFIFEKKISNFLKPCCARKASNLAKSDNMGQKMSIGVSKTDADWNPLKYSYTKLLA
jgi:hypothetical protein